MVRPDTSSGPLQPVERAMIEPNFVILYVDSPPASTEFYADLLGRPPVEASPTFAMFALNPGVMLGLWSRATVAPAAGAAPGSGEIAFTARAREDVDATHADWRKRGLAIAQPPV